MSANSAKSLCSPLAEMSALLTEVVSLLLIPNIISNKKFFEETPI
ncbi:MAG: hypothetical protein ACOVNU_03810 [Candidatus Kapaibacteriota bacterium]